MAFDFFKRLRQPLAEVKSVTLPELLLTYSRSAPIFQKWDTETAIEQGLKASAISTPAWTAAPSPSPRFHGRPTASSVTEA